MPELWANLTHHPETVRWIAAGAAALIVITAVALLLWRIFRRKPSSEEIERRRREMIHGNGKIGDCEIIDVDGSVIVYSYSVGGVEYTVGQDASSIESLLPEDRMRMVGPASVRFDPKNPPNSIVVCEHWTGLRLRAVSDRIG